ncbi:MAG TPA: glycoside hydrolase family 43 protein [Chloroflexota bacterium]|nr:glycoside hydrolase family 43 protein [Chloroflexota bacterium]
MLLPTRLQLLSSLVVLGLLIAPSATALVHAGAKAARVPRYSNPVFAKDFPDPMVLRDSQTSYYAYGTTTSWELGYFPILHSSDLVHWKYVGDIFKVPPSWASNDLWAPDVIRSGKTYYAYYTGLAGSTHCIAVATSPKPTGPFRPRDVIGCSDRNGKGYIDPAVLVDRNHRAYLYVSVDNPTHDISVIPLKSDLLHAGGARKVLFGIDQPWEHGANFSTVEGPYAIKHGSTYYLFFSGNDWNGNYSMGYATAASPLGPFTPYSGNPILQGTDTVKGPGGGSVVQGPDNKLWMVYHAWQGPEGYSQGGVRVMYLDPIIWHGAAASVTVTTK